MGKAPASQFYWGDLRRDPEYHMMSWSARGVWIEMLACMHFSNERGKLQGDREQIARMIGCTNGDFDNALKEISVTKTGDVTECNNLVTIINRRMFREQKERENTRLRVQKYRSNKVSNANVTPPSSSSSSSSKEKIYIEKKVFGEFQNVNLSEEEHKKLIVKFGEIGTKDRIEGLSTGLESKGYKYKSHYATILSWDRKHEREQSKTKSW